jgi:hypothetical protein
MRRRVRGHLAAPKRRSGVPPHPTSSLGHLLPSGEGSVGSRAVTSPVLRATLPESGGELRRHVRARGQESGSKLPHSTNGRRLEFAKGTPWRAPTIGPTKRAGAGGDGV